MKIQERNGQYTLTLSKPLVEGLRWGKGTVIRAEIVGKDALKLVRQA